MLALSECVFVLLKEESCLSVSICVFNLTSGVQSTASHSLLYLCETADAQLLRT